MAEETSIPPSRALARRLRALIASLDAASVESTAKQVCEWIDSSKDHNDRFRGLLRLSAGIVLEEAMERRGQSFHRLLGRFCKILDTATGGESSRFLNSSWKQEIQAAGAELQTNTMAEAGTWPEYHALVAFAGELCDQALLQPGSLRSCTHILSGSGSNLGLELACTLVEATGYALREDSDGERCLDAAIQAMLSASGRDGVSARMRRRVQELTAQRTPRWARHSDNETADSSTGEDRHASQTTPQLCKPRHARFYFGSGDIVFVCEDTSFRVQSDLLSSNSQVLSDALMEARSNVEHLSDGCPCVHLSDTAEDFATLLRVFYTSGFPHRHKTPDFATFSSLLRMATKYKFQEIRLQILLDLRSAYPVKFSDFEAASCRGEAIFGSPLPHPNSVLDLFVKCNVTSALPFAFYRACIAGDPTSLNSKVEGTVLLPSTFEAALCGHTRLKAGEVQLAKTLAFKDCGSWRCSGQTPASRTQVFNWIHPKAAARSGILERDTFTGSGFCSQCLKNFAEGLSEAKGDIWENLPSYFGLPPWDAPTLHLYPVNDSFIPKHIALLPQQRVKIGRQTNAKTVPTERNGYFGSKALSTRHAEVWEQDGKIYIRDLKSSNGTFINNERLSGGRLESKPFELKSDDILEFGTDIVGEDKKTIIHRKVAARVLCVLDEQDAQAAARVE